MLGGYTTMVRTDVTEGRGHTLSEPESKQLLARYGLRFGEVMSSSSMISAIRMSGTWSRSSYVALRRAGSMMETVARSLLGRKEKESAAIRLLLACDWGALLRTKEFTFFTSYPSLLLFSLGRSEQIL